MNQNEKNMLYAFGGILLLGVLLWLAFRKKPATVIYNVDKSRETKGETDSETKDTPANPPLFPLKQGSKGRQVEQLQRFLIKEKKDIKADGIFGPQTATALQELLQVSEVNEDLFKEKQMGGFKTTVYPPPAKSTNPVSRQVGLASNILFNKPSEMGTTI